MLVIDIGNTHTRIAHFVGSRIGKRKKYSTRTLNFAEVEAGLSEIVAGEQNEMVWIASVAPHHNATVGGVAEKLGLSYRFIVSARDFILPHRLKTPETTGVDRLLSAFAASEFLFTDYRGGFVIVQCGSAATVDWVDHEGVYRGGFILPGPSLWLSGLGEAAQLPDLSTVGVDWNDVSPGASTRVSMLHGLAVGLPAAVTAAIKRIACEPDLGLGENEEARIAFTGGWAETVREHLGVSGIFDPDLLLHGIRIFAERETGKS